MSHGGMLIEKVWMNFPEEAHTRTLSLVATTMIAIVLSEKRSAEKISLHHYRPLKDGRIAKESTQSTASAKRLSTVSSRNYGIEKNAQFT